MLFTKKNFLYLDKKADFIERLREEKKYLLDLKNRREPRCCIHERKKERKETKGKTICIIVSFTLKKALINFSKESRKKRAGGTELNRYIH
jgi:hypothetical protein